MTLPMHHSSPVPPPYTLHLRVLHEHSCSSLSSVQPSFLTTKGLFQVQHAQTGVYVFDKERCRKSVQLKWPFQSGAAGSLSRSVGENALTESHWQGNAQ